MEGAYNISSAVAFAMPLAEFPLPVFFIGEAPGKPRGIDLRLLAASAKTAAAFTACLTVFAILAFPNFLFYRQ